MDAKEMKELAELIEFLKQNQIAEFDLEREGRRVRIKFAGAQGAAGVDLAQLGALLAAKGAAAPAVTAAAPIAAAADEAPVDNSHFVKSPIVGTFYESPSPGSPAFVKVGDMVEVGQVLCIVEAMKLMNEIESDVAGEVVQQIATPGQPVEYGQRLYAIKPR